MKTNAAICPKCGAIFSEDTNLNCPWSWQKSVGLHDDGCHKMIRFNTGNISRPVEKLLAQLAIIK